MSIANRFKQYGLLLEDLQSKGLSFELTDYFLCSEYFIKSHRNSCRHSMISCNNINMFEDYVIFYSTEIRPGIFEFNLMAKDFHEKILSSEHQSRNRILNKVDELISSWKTNRWKYYMGPFHGHIAKPLTLFPLGM
mgnify:FL=1|jgi:hypothetical protein